MKLKSEFVKKVWGIGYKHDLANVAQLI
jgi:hypothetical protein